MQAESMQQAALTDVKSALEVIKLRRAVEYLAARVRQVEIEGILDTKSTVEALIEDVRRGVLAGEGVEPALKRAQWELEPGNADYTDTLRPFLSKALARFWAADRAVQAVGGSSLSDLGEGLVDPFLTPPSDDCYADDLQAMEATANGPRDPRSTVAADIDERLRATGRTFVQVHGHNLPA